jgi:FtsP/CotA-like multicopper oxidase with cupredoxin domain
MGEMIRSVYGRGVVATGVLVLALLSRHADGQSAVQAVGWDANLKLVEAADLNPDPHVVEINLTARVASVEIAPGTRVDAWTYDGRLPGPLIRVRVGDRLIVHFLNRLPQPTTIHWHGLRVPIQMDGVPEHSQPEVKPGESFTYDFTVPDAGLFWYHPHVMSAAQVGFGLYGALLVEDPAERVGVNDELVLVLSDIGFDDHGTLESPESGGTTGMVFGREGNHLLVNGREHPTLVMRSGAPQRWRIVNAAKSRYFELELGDESFTQIGGDGGLQERSLKRETVVLAAGERADLIVTPHAAPGKELTLRALLFDRGYGSVEYRQPEDLVTVKMADAPPASPVVLPDVTRAIEPLSTEGATKVNIDLTLGQRSDGKFEYGINGVPFAKDRPVPAKPGETQVWTVTNKTKWSHPFHLHGFFFQVLGDHGEPVRPLQWKDTVNVPFDKTVRFVVRFDDRAGSWMFHCHILDHADGGLMGMIELGMVHHGKLE